MQLPCPSAALFRLVILIALACWLAAQILPTFGLVTFTENVAAARLWSYADTPLPYWTLTLWWVASGLATAGALLGLLSFREWARWLLVAVLAGGVLMQPFMGLAVYSPLEGTLGSLYGTAFIWLATVSFWTPLGVRFRARSVQ